MLTTEQLQELAALIDTRRFRLEAELRRDAARSRAQPYADLAGATADSGEEATADVMVDIGNAELSRDLRELRALQAARARIESGSYGRCADCGADIGYQRLTAEPSALRCLPCQQRHDRTHGRAPTPSL
ncbi:MAG TPA: TraR/DksA C4-type zinc finger protein [Burkholderiales bacterium]|nr:TraR/DksA C4-type zinc finger protein [Burkholderiales bacterium]